MATEYKLSYTATEIDEKLGKIDDLATKSEVPTKTSELTNDSGFLTSVPGEYVTETELSSKGYLTEHQDLSSYALKTEIPTVVSDLQNDSGFLTSYTETDPTVPAWAKASTKPSYTASEVGADASGTASSAVSAHNSDGAAHSGIREQISQLSSEKVDKSGLTLGVHTDGFVYIFVNGSPQGNGLDIKTDVVEGDVFGYVDENNNIVLNGKLPDGTYNIKYEMEDGTVMDIGDMVLDSNTYYTVTNTLTQCTTNNSATKVVQGGSYSATISASSGYELSSIKVTMSGTDISTTAVSGGNISIAEVTGDIIITAVAEEVQTSGYTNLADPTSADWQEDYRLSISSGSTAALAGHTTTNYIPCKQGDVLRVKGLNIVGYLAGATSDSANAAKIVMYNSSKTKLGGVYGLTTVDKDLYGNKVAVNGDIRTYTILIGNDDTQNATASCAYIRIDGELMDGYTKNDVIITINEAIDDSSSGDTEEGTTSSYTNLLPLAVDADGNDYVGDNGEDGYKSGYKMSTSSGNESATSGAYCSGFMPISDIDDYIYVKNVTLSNTAKVNNFVFYDANKVKTREGSAYGSAGAFNVNVKDLGNGVYRCKPSSWLSTSMSVAFFRFSCGGITDETIVTVNQEIV